jgi:PTS system nitrogen regulatory IIA component
MLADDLIIDEIKGATKLEVLQEFSDLLYENKVVGDRDGLTRVLMARESLGSTGIGDGVAIPHGKLKGLGGLVLAFGRSTRGVDFDSLDGRLAHLFFLLIAPEDAPGEHLKALARISRLMKNGDLRESLMRAAGKKEIKSVISNGEDGRQG